MFGRETYIVINKNYTYTLWMSDVPFLVKNIAKLLDLCESVAIDPHEVMFAIKIAKKNEHKIMVFGANNYFLYSKQ